MPSLSKYTFGPMRAVHIIIITLLPQMEMCTATLKKDQVLSHFSQAYMDSSLSLCRSRPRRILKLADTFCRRALSSAGNTQIADQLFWPAA